MTRFLQLGASLYVPATRSDLTAIGNGAKLPELRSVIFCTEDAIAPGQVPEALRRLDAALRRIEPSPLLRFVRVRSPEVLRSVLQMDGVDRLTGFVVPKATHRNLGDYLDLLAPEDPFEIMVTLESAEVFDAHEMIQLRDLLQQEASRRRVLSLRFGGNDLLQLLGMRRSRNRSIYQTPLGAVIDRLVTTFRPHGFNLTGPVVEYLDQPRALAREARLDVAHGLFGKSAIHPAQVPIIEEQYRVSARDFEAAQRILDADAPSVFRHQEAMCEPATHRAWAQIACERARLYGVRGALRRPRLLPLGAQDVVATEHEAREV